MKANTSIKMKKQQVNINNNTIGNNSNVNYEKTILNVNSTLGTRPSFLSNQNQTQYTQQQQIKESRDILVLSSDRKPYISQNAKIKDISNVGINSSVSLKSIVSTKNQDDQQSTTSPRKGGDKQQSFKISKSFSQIPPIIQQKTKKMKEQELDEQIRKTVYNNIMEKRNSVSTNANPFYLTAAGSQSGFYSLKDLQKSEYSLFDKNVNNKFKTRTSYNKLKNNNSYFLEHNSKNKISPKSSSQNRRNSFENQEQKTPISSCRNDVYLNSVNNNENNSNISSNSYMNLNQQEHTKEKKKIQKSPLQSDAQIQINKLLNQNYQKNLQLKMKKYSNREPYLFQEDVEIIKSQLPIPDLKTMESGNLAVIEILKANQQFNQKQTAIQLVMENSQHQKFDNSIKKAYKEDENRKEIIELVRWYESTVQSVFSQNQKDLSQLFEQLQIIYRGTFRELNRQINTDCQEKAELMKLLWEDNNKLLGHMIRTQKEIYEDQRKKDRVHQKGVGNYFQNYINNFDQQMEFNREEMTNQISLNEKLLEKANKELVDDNFNMKFDYDRVKLDYNFLVDSFKQLQEDYEQLKWAELQRQQNPQDFESENQVVASKEYLIMTIKQILTNECQKHDINLDNLLKNQLKEQEIHQKNQEQEEKAMNNDEQLNEILLKNQLDNLSQQLLSTKEQGVNTEMLEVNEVEIQTDQFEIPLQKVQVSKTTQYNENDILNSLSSTEKNKMMNLIDKSLDDLFNVNIALSEEDDIESLQQGLDEVKKDVIRFLRKESVSYQNENNLEKNQKMSEIYVITRKLILLSDRQRENLLEHKMKIVDQELELSKLQRTLNSKKTDFQKIREQYLQESDVKKKKKKLLTTGLGGMLASMNLLKPHHVIKEKKQDYLSEEEEEDEDQDSSISSIFSHQEVTQPQQYRSQQDTQEVEYTPKNEMHQHSSSNQISLSKLYSQESIGRDRKASTNKLQKRTTTFSEICSSPSNKIASTTINPKSPTASSMQNNLSKSKQQSNTVNIIFGDGGFSKQQNNNSKKSVKLEGTQQQQQNQMQQSQKHSNATMMQSASLKFGNTTGKKSAMGQSKQMSNLKKKQSVAISLDVKQNQNQLSVPHNNNKKQQQQQQSENQSPIRSKRNSESFLTNNNTNLSNLPSPSPNKHTSSTMSQTAAKLQRKTVFQEFKFKKTDEGKVKEETDKINLSQAQFIVETVKKAQVKTREVGNNLQIIKQLGGLYAEFDKNSKNGLKTPLSLLVYETFINKYGMRKIAEKKLYDFYVKLKSMRSVPRVAQFLQLTNVETIQEISTSYSTFKEAEFYVKCYALLDEQFIQEKPFSNFDKAKTNVVLAVKAAKQVFQDILNPEQMAIFLEQISSEQNFNIDKILFEFLDIYQLFIQSRYSKYDVFFDAVNFKGEKFINFKQMLLLVKNISQQMFEEKEYFKMFDKWSDDYNEDSQQITISRTRFAEMCMEKKILTEQELQQFTTQHISFVHNINNSSKRYDESERLLEDKIFGQIELKNYWPELKKNIKMRLIHTKSYNQIYQNLFQKLEDLTSQSKWDKKMEQIALLIFKILSNESKKLSIIYFTNNSLPSQLLDLQNTFSTVFEIQNQQPSHQESKMSNNQNNPMK